MQPSIGSNIWQSLGVVNFHLALGMLVMANVFEQVQTPAPQSTNDVMNAPRGGNSRTTTQGLPTLSFLRPPVHELV